MLMSRFDMHAYYVWLLVSMLCLAYFAVCCAASGAGNLFNYVWLFGAVACGAVFVAVHGDRCAWFVLPHWLKAGFVVLFSIGCLYFAAMEALVVSGLWADADDGADYVIVLGAHVKGDVVSGTLKKRLDVAYDYAVRPENSNAVIIVTGGQGKGENLPEGDAMKAYLVDRGIAADRILVENTSVNTDENLDNSIELYIGDRASRVVVVSSNFHIYRALRLARAKGLSVCQGLAAPTEHVLLPNYMVREAVGITKEMVFGNF